MNKLDAADGQPRNVTPLLTLSGGKCSKNRKLTVALVVFYYFQPRNAGGLFLHLSSPQGTTWWVKAKAVLGLNDVCNILNKISSLTIMLHKLNHQTQMNIIKADIHVSRQC